MKIYHITVPNSYLGEWNPIIIKFGKLKLHNYETYKKHYTCLTKDHDDMPKLLG